MNKRLLLGAFACLLFIACGTETTDTYKPTNEEDETKLNVFKAVSVTPSTTVYYGFEEDVTIHEKPDDNSSVVGSLSLGEEIKVLKRNQPKQTVDNHTERWFEVEKDNQVGYVWGGYVSDLALTGNLDNQGADELLLLSDKTIDPTVDGSDNNRYSYKVVRDNKLVAESTVSTYFGFDFKSISLKKPVGFSPALYLVEVSFNFKGEITGKGREYLTFSDRKLETALKVNLTEEENDFRCSSDVIFPKDLSGKENEIKIKEKCGTVNCTSDCENETYVYIWNGKKFMR